MKYMPYPIPANFFSTTENKRHNMPIRDELSKCLLFGKRNKPVLKISSCSFLGLLGDVVSLSITLQGAAEDFCSQGGHPQGFISLLGLQGGPQPAEKLSSKMQNYCNS